MNRIKALRTERGIKQADLAQRLKVGQNTISNWENGKTEPDTDLLQAIAQIFNTSVDDILGFAGAKNSDDAVRIPVFSRVAAGIPIEAIEDVVDWEEIPRALCSGERQYFALRVSGDSMWPDYLQGDTVIVRRQDTCESGDDCVVYVNSTDATLKQVKLGDCGELTLIPRNQSYPPRTFTAQEVTELPVTIAGVVVEMRRKMKS